MGLFCNDNARKFHFFFFQFMLEKKKLFILTTLGWEKLEYNYRHLMRSRCNLQLIKTTVLLQVVFFFRFPNYYYLYIYLPGRDGSEVGGMSNEY